MTQVFVAMPNQNMTNDSKSDISENDTRSGKTWGRFLKVGAVAAASAILGGVAAAWWYRKTITTLHETGENGNNPHFGIGSQAAQEGAEDEI